MPVIAKTLLQPLDAELQSRLEKLQPSFRLHSPSVDAVLYIGWFNEKPVAAAWVVGADAQREVQGLAIHPATRGRGVLSQLVQQIQTQEGHCGRRVLCADDYAALDR